VVIVEQSQCSKSRLCDRVRKLQHEELEVSEVGSSSPMGYAFDIDSNSSKTKG
jgi:hypothetical protein